MDELRAHYQSFDRQEMVARDVLRADQSRFCQSAPKRDIHFVGVDRAQFASSYGFWAGHLDDAIPEDFEVNDPSTLAASTTACCDVVISTGVVDYVTERTFERILRCQSEDELPWIASFVLRMFDYNPVAESLKQFGYVTEKLSGRYFRQRRFADDAERCHVERLLAKRNLCTAGLEANGHYLAEFFLSRPGPDMKAQPLTSFLH